MPSSRRRHSSPFARADRRRPVRRARTGRHRAAADADCARLLRRSLFIPATARAPTRTSRSMPMSSPRHGALCARSCGTRQLWTRSVAVSWFWMAGAVALSLTPVVIRNKTGGGIERRDGDQRALRARHRNRLDRRGGACQGPHLLRPVPFAALGMAAFLIDLGASTARLPWQQRKWGSATFFISMSGSAPPSTCWGSPAPAASLSCRCLRRSRPMRRQPGARDCRRRQHFESGFHSSGGDRDSRAAELTRGRDEPALLAALGFLNLGAAFYVRKSTAQGAA